MKVDIKVWKDAFKKSIQDEYSPNTGDYFVSLDHMLELVDKFNLEAPGTDKP